ncbi:hypothetical protein BC941DRAFT_444471 [Chlamydoabsidia padenii]|nr:hypothetical protein BC941DRAFT_444471 [Chlamydoabsidia padenii]
MPPKQIIGTNASSIIDLKALVSQQKEKFNRERHDLYIKPETKKRPRETVNRGVSERAKRDTATTTTTTENDAVEKSRAILERKARLYDTLQRRRTKESDDDDNILVDFDQKYHLQQQEEEPDSIKSKMDDPWVEYEDEFGRTRVVRSSTLREQQEQEEQEQEESLSPPPPLSPTFADRANIRHYNATQEIRTKGVGHYSFASEDDTKRQQQMASLNALRKETESARKQSRSASERRKAILAKRAELIHQRWAKIRQTRPPSGTINDDSITQLLQTMRNKVKRG